MIKWLVYILFAIYKCNTKLSILLLNSACREGTAIGKLNLRTSLHHVTLLFQYQKIMEPFLQFETIPSHFYGKVSVK